MPNKLILLEPKVRLNPNQAVNSNLSVVYRFLKRITNLDNQRNLVSLFSARADLERAASGASGTCGHFESNIPFF